MRGSDAPVVECAVCGQAVDQVVGLTLVIAAREEAVTELGGRVVTPAEQAQSRDTR